MRVTISSGTAQTKWLRAFRIRIAMQKPSTTPLGLRFARSRSGSAGSSASLATLRPRHSVNAPGSTAISAMRSQRNLRIAAALGFYGAFFLGNALCFLYTTRRGKVQVWDEVLDDLRLHGDERVLDMGCGRGASSPPSPGG